MKPSLRLNLGCGRRQIDGWTGVDVRNYGQDHIADIRRLPFADESADAIMAIHVLEHFYLWEVQGLMAEWVRVLRPDGELIVEVPDIFLAVSRMANGVDDPQLTWWVLYGDPKHKDELQCHHWGYTIKTLRELFENNGLRDIKSGPGKFKQKERRDIRVTGRK